MIAESIRVRNPWTDVLNLIQIELLQRYRRAPESERPELRAAILATLNGVAAGSAFQAAMLTDVRVGHPGVRMGQAEINSGIPSVTGPMLMLPRIGLSRTIELTLTGRMMDAEECRAIGLIHYLVDRPEQVVSKTREVAEAMAAKGARN